MGTGERKQVKREINGIDKGGRDMGLGQNTASFYFVCLRDVFMGRKKKDLREEEGLHNASELKLQ